MEKMRKLLEKESNGLGSIIEVNDNDFEEKVIKQSFKVPVVVDFWAVWCGPCLILSPTLEKLVQRYDGRFILAKFDVDENPIISQRYGIMSIPSVKLFRDGEIINEFIGAIPEAAVGQWLNKSIGKGD